MSDAELNAGQTVQSGEGSGSGSGQLQNRHPFLGEEKDHWMNRHTCGVQSSLLAEVMSRKPANTGTQSSHSRSSFPLFQSVSKLPLLGERQGKQMSVLVQGPRPHLPP